MQACVLSDRESQLTAAFVPTAGMIGVSLADNGVELLGQRRGLDAYRSSGKTMGIPLLHPWANRLSASDYAVAGETVALAPDAVGVHHDNNGLPMHGLLAARPDWRVESVAADELVVVFDFGACPELLASFPFPHRLTLAVSLAGRRLTLRTTLAATSAKPVPVSFGFHPYLCIPDAPRERWEVELPPRRRLVLDGCGIPTGEGANEPGETAVLGDRVFDDGYDTIAAGAVFAVSAGRRRLEVSLDEGYPCAQIFAPAGEEVVCFEPMTAPTNALRSGDQLQFARPGKPYNAQFSITARPAP
ncbi:aldose 1-epimerase [Segniliparus rotundus]|uniref:aldose 1-epimerase n=1 Tax=Segniliparus rotundus TaxID=286802 RepID=UPI003CCA7720